MYKSLISKNHEFDLSEEEKSILLETWNDDHEFLFNFGASVFDKIFLKYPNLIQLFPQTAIHGENWRSSNDFRLQIIRIVGVRHDKKMIWLIFQFFRPCLHLSTT